MDWSRLSWLLYPICALQDKHGSSESLQQKSISNFNEVGMECLHNPFNAPWHLSISAQVFFEF